MLMLRTRMYECVKKSVRWPSAGIPVSFFLYDAHLIELFVQVFTRIVFFVLAGSRNSS